MPELDGPAATRLIHARARRPQPVDHRGHRRRAARHPRRLHGRRHGRPPHQAAGGRGPRPRRSQRAVATSDVAPSDGSRCSTRPRSTTCASWSAATRRRCPGWSPTSWPRPRRSCTNCATRSPSPIPNARTGRRTRCKGLGATFGATAMAQLCQRAETDGSAEETVAAIAARTRTRRARACAGLWPDRHGFDSTPRRLAITWPPFSASVFARLQGSAPSPSPGGPARKGCLR